MAIIHNNGFSTAVRIHLEVEGLSLSVSQVGDSSLILRHPENIDAVDNAQLVITVDGEALVHPIALPQGIHGRMVTFEEAPARLFSPRASTANRGTQDVPF